MWIHEHHTWPHFTWDIEALSSKLSDIRHQQGLLLGKMSTLGFNLKNEANLSTITSDIIKSSIIEGEKLDANEVRSSIARKLGIDIAGLLPDSRNVDGIVEMMLDATQNFSKPLNQERLFNWHGSLFPTGRSGMQKIKVAQWRPLSHDPMQVVSGAVGREKVHFEAPSADRLGTEMNMFLDWFNKEQSVDPILKAGIAHFWFVTIHPFEDGNGRIARAIGDMALARADNIKNRYYSLSSQIELQRKDYYIQLERQQRSSPDISIWLDWFLSCLDKTFKHSEKKLSKILFKSKLWNFIKQKPINERQNKIITRMLDDDFKGHMNTSKYAKLSKCSNDTALRDIKNLQQRGILIQNEKKGRSTSYRLLMKFN